MKKVLERQQAIWKLEDRNLEMIQVEKEGTKTKKMRKFYENYLSLLGRATLG